MHRMLISGTGRVFIQDTPESDVHCQYGKITAEAINKAKDGDIIESNKQEKLIVYTPTFIDKYKRIRRQAQIITFKDAGVIITTAGLGPEMIVAEAGTGSGAMTVLLARHCKQVYSYDINEENQAIAKENLMKLGIKNVTFKLHDITKGLPDGPVDCVLLDMPEPWHTFYNLNNLKIGGYVVTYTPSAIQLQQVRLHAQKVGLLHIRSVEVTERHWMVREQAVRPTSRNTAFTAFLTFHRWMGPNYKQIMPVHKEKNKPALPSAEEMQALFE